MKCRRYLFGYFVKYLAGDVDGTDQAAIRYLTSHNAEGVVA